jgi:hypothetical protein
MRGWHALVVVAIFVLAIPAVYHASPPATPEPTQQEAAITGPNYLYINELEIAPGMIPSEAVAEASTWVNALRETGDFKSVRLFIHNTGPRFALYVIVEPNSWQSMETGFSKFLEAYAMMDKPWPWGTHSDNLLSEILVQ